MDTDIYFMNIALKEARKAFRKQEVPVGAVITYQDKIIARGHNLRELKGDITKHAELIAIKKANKKRKDWRLIDCTIYITLFPCSMCASAIMQSRIKRIVLGAETNDLKNYQITQQLFCDEKGELIIQISKNVLQDECSQLLKKFFENRRNKKKITL